MKWLAALAASVGLASGTAHAGCPATFVHGQVVKAGPFSGYIVPRYDVIEGRFRLHVGAYRDRATGLSQKIPWFVPLRYRVGGSLAVRGMRFEPSGRTFKQVFQLAYSADTPDQNVFPSNITPPAPGCWRLTFRSAGVNGALIVYVHG